MRRPLREVLPGPDGGESLAARFAGPDPSEETLEMMIPKWMSADDIHIIIEGAWGGMFSSFIPGWVGTSIGSIVVTEPIDDPGA